MAYIHKGAFDGDEFAYGLFKGFLEGYFDKFFEKGSHPFKGKSGLLKEVLDKPSCFETGISGHSFKTDDEFVNHMKEIVVYGKQFMARCDIRVFLEHYEKEWQGIENGYYFAQYNSMKLASSLKYFVAEFVRKQLYSVQQLRSKLYHREKGTKVWMTSMKEIDQFGIYDPDPSFLGVKKEPDRLSTRFKDIELLKDLLDKYSIVKWRKEPDKDGYIVSKYTGFNCFGILQMLNTLKYKHLNFGNKGRRTLDIDSKQTVYRSQLNIEKDVTGFYSWNYGEGRSE